MSFQFTDQNFKSEIEKGLAVLDIYADWCGPCKMMAPIFEELAKEYEGKVKMGQLNVDENPETPGKFGVASIPTIIFFKDGKEMSRLVGFQSKEALIKQIEGISGSVT